MSEEFFKNVPSDQLVGNFYRSNENDTSGNLNECVLNVKRAFNEQKSKAFPAVFKSSINGPSTDWKVFKQLAPALSFADSATKDCMVFSFEERAPYSSGQRLFLVAHPQHLWLNYKSRFSEERCTYEVIKEDVPCKLYLDLEFSRLLNPERDGNKMTKVFIKCILAHMYSTFGIKYELSEILWLDSSTDVKFSCHLILQMGDIAFENNYHVGFFIALLLSQIEEKISSDREPGDLWPPTDDLKSLFVKVDKERSQVFCDDGVYTKNRNFRLYLSTKYGKNAPLVVSEHNVYQPEVSSNCSDLDEVIFYDSMVTYFRNGSKFSRLLNFEENETVELISKSTCHPRIRSSMSNISNNGSSPYPELDNFVQSLIKDSVSTGFIRKWIKVENEDIVIYEIANFRYCRNIGRHHKSNNIMIIVDLRRELFYQKCHDPECKKQGYKSPVQPLPEHLMQLYKVPDNFFCVEFSEDQTISNGIHSSESSDSQIITCLDGFEDNFFTPTVEGTTYENDIPSNTTLAEIFRETDFFMEEEPIEKAQNSPQQISDDDIPSEDELLMAEAAAAIEMNMDGGFYSEETIF